MEDQFAIAIAKEQIVALKKKLEKAEEAVAQAEQEGYDVGVKETEENLRAKVTGVCRGYYLQVWNEALNQARVDASSELRRTKNILYSPTLCITSPSNSRVDIVLQALKSS